MAPEGTRMAQTPPPLTLLSPAAGKVRSCPLGLARSFCLADPTNDCGPLPRSLLIFTAVTYHELFQLAARDALSAIAALDWSALYRRLAAAEAAEGPRFGAEAAQAELMEMGASAAEARAATQVLFASDGRIIPEATFVARAARTMAPLRLAAAAGG
eukprot:scaffold27815_cov86-Isochrysis_galbana.AAC.2